MACLHCRQRKRRCDGARPVCGLCRGRNLQCVYVDKEPIARASRSRRRSDVSRHSAQAIERLLQSQGDVLRTLQQILGSPDSDRHVVGRGEFAGEVVDGEDLEGEDSEGENSGEEETRNAALSTLPTPQEEPSSTSTTPVARHHIAPSSGYFTRSQMRSPYMRLEDPEVPPFTIPPGHEASSSTLLGLPQVQSLVGSFPREYFYRVETRHSQAFSLALDDDTVNMALPPITREAADALVATFFEQVHTFHPLFDEEAFFACYDTAMNQGLRHDELSALILLIFALGALVRDGPRDWAPQGSGNDAILCLQYFKPARQILLTTWAQSVGGNLVLSQGLFLCAVFLMHLPQPLLAMKFVHLASTTVEQYLIRSANTSQPPSRLEETLRLSWACFAIECDLLAEFHESRSGIQFLADKMLFPSCGTPPVPSRLYFLAEISARSLVNRIHYTINYTDSISKYIGSTTTDGSVDVDNLSTLRNICDELARQLQTWTDSLPDEIKIDMMPDSLDVSMQNALLRCRYWSSRNKIYRPWVLKATSLPAGMPLPTDLIEQCQECIVSCREFVNCAGKLLRRRNPYLYTASHGTFAAALMLSLSALSPALLEYISDLDTLLTVALDALRPWADAGSAIESSYEILSTMRNKFRHRDYNSF